MERRTAVDADDAKVGARLGPYEEQCVRRWHTAGNGNDAEVGEVLAGTANTEAAAEDDAEVRAPLGPHEEQCLRGWRTAFDANDAEVGTRLGPYEEQCVRGWRTAANDDDAKVGEALDGTAETEEAKDHHAGFGEALEDATETEAADEDDPSCCQTWYLLSLFYQIFMDCFQVKQGKLCRVYQDFNL